MQRSISQLQVQSRHQIQIPIRSRSRVAAPHRHHTSSSRREEEEAQAAAHLRHYNNNKRRRRGRKGEKKKQQDENIRNPKRIREFPAHPAAEEAKKLSKLTRKQLPSDADANAASSTTWRLC